MEHDEALRRAGALATVAAAHADEAEAGCRMPADTVDAFVRSDLAGLVAPTAIGGHAAHPGTAVEVIETVTRADGSAGWCTGIGMGSNYLAAIIDEGAAKELFTDISRAGAGPFAPFPAQVTAAGYRVSGRWSYASGCQHAAVSANGIMAFDEGRPAELHPDGAPVMRLAFLSEDQFSVEETWDTVGMRGTGSHDELVADVEVPRERTGTLWGETWPDDPIFRLRSFDVLGPSLGAVPLGLGRAALDVIAAKVRAEEEHPPPPGPRLRFADDPISQRDLAVAEARLRGARALLLDAVDAAYDHALRGDTPPRAATALVGVACHEALAAATVAVETACRLSGSGAIRVGQPLDRIRRDLSTAGTHVMFSTSIGAGFGRQLAGIDTVVFPFLPTLDG